jgi:hypothetical protein
MQELDAFLRAHAQRETVAVALYAAGDALFQRLSGSPPADPRWGRFLVAMGEVAAERLDDGDAAARWFRRCLDQESVHRDAEACVAAGFGQGVLWERAADLGRALPTYRAAAAEGLRCLVMRPATVRAASAAVRLGFERAGALQPGDAALAKQAWLVLTWLHHNEPAAIDEVLIEEAGRQLCAFLLPEDDPTRLAALWRAWTPHAVGDWTDGSPACLAALFAIAARAADRHLPDEGGGAAYRLLAEACAPKGPASLL